MEIHEVKLEARNIPELYEHLTNKFNVKEVKNIDRKFVRFEGTNFVYIYKVKIVLHGDDNVCTSLSHPVYMDKNISGQLAWFGGKRVCQYCYKSLTKAKSVHQFNKKIYKVKIIKLFSK